MEHAALINELGGGTKVAAALTERTGTTIDREAVYKWKVHGVPWRWRIHVARLAQEAGKSVPADFLGAPVTELRPAS